MSKNKNENAEISRILTEQTDFTTVETYKSIRTSVLFSVPKSDTGKVIVVTSSAPNEGKTTTVINLAITFAQMGAKVVLLDCDLRKARVHKYLGLERMDGISNVLCGFVDLEKAIKRSVRENLDCITAGAIPPNPAGIILWTAALIPMPPQMPTMTAIRSWLSPAGAISASSPARQRGPIPPASPR